MAPDVNLVIPLKPIASAKSRLAGALAAPGSPRHADLVRALAKDTITAARSAPTVRRIIVVAADPREVADFGELGVEVIGEQGPRGLNSALRHGTKMLRAADPWCVVGALQADLPALVAEDLERAIAEARCGRAFCADRHGAGTTLLLSAAGEDLDPRFGPGSAAAHAKSGAVALVQPGPSLRADVDTPADLGYASTIGLGARSRAIMGAGRRAG